MTTQHDDLIQITTLAMNESPIDLAVELRFANGMSADYYQTSEESIREALHLLADPRLFAQRHLLFTSRWRASMIPCAGIDMILVRTLAPVPVRFPLNLPVGRFDLSEGPEELADDDFAPQEQCEKKPGDAHQHTARVGIRTLGGWKVSLLAMAAIRGQMQDERQFFAHLPDVPTIPFRLPEGGIGLINTANITMATVTPKPEALTGTALPLIMRREMARPRCQDDLAFRAKLPRLQKPLTTTD